MLIDAIEANQVSTAILGYRGDITQLRDSGMAGFFGRLKIVLIQTIFLTAVTAIPDFSSYR